MADPELSPSFFETKIAGLEEQEGQLKAELERITRQLAWYREGLAIHQSPNGSAAHSDSGDSQPEAAALGPVELVPATDVLQATGTKPKLRMAILRVMLDREPTNAQEAAWKVPPMIGELMARGWAPEGKHAENIVRHMMGDMVKRGQLRRPLAGVYMLSPGIRSGQLDAGDG
jgi:hypothetical protein